MAEVVLIAPIETIKGKFHKQDKTILRRKRVFDAQGHIIGQLQQEAYVVHNPRDRKKNPPTGAEKQRHDNWTIACQRAKIELADESKRAVWQQRWEAQLQQPEADAPIDPNTQRPKQYIRFDCFVRAAIFRSLAAK